MYNNNKNNVKAFLKTYLNMKVACVLIFNIKNVFNK